MLGHASLETTQLYTHVTLGQIQRAHRRYHPAARDAASDEASLRKALRAESKTLGCAQLAQVLGWVRRLRDAELSGTHLAGQGPAETALVFYPPEISPDSGANWVI